MQIQIENPNIATNNGSRFIRLTQRTDKEIGYADPVPLSIKVLDDSGIPIPNQQAILRFVIADDEQWPTEISVEKSSTNDNGIAEYLLDVNYLTPQAPINTQCAIIEVGEIKERVWFWPPEGLPMQPYQESASVRRELPNQPPAEPDENEPTEISPDEALRLQFEQHSAQLGKLFSEYQVRLCGITARIDDKKAIALKEIKASIGNATTQAINKFEQQTKINSGFKSLPNLILATAVVFILLSTVSLILFIKR